MNEKLEEEDREGAEKKNNFWKLSKSTEKDWSAGLRSPTNLSRINTDSYIRVKLLKTKDNEKILNTVREKRLFCTE